MYTAVELLPPRWNKRSYTLKCWLQASKFHLPLSQVPNFSPLLCINRFISLNKGEVGLGSDISCSSESKIKKRVIKCHVITIFTSTLVLKLIIIYEVFSLCDFSLHTNNHRKSGCSLNTSGNIPHTSLPLHLGKSPCIGLLPFLPRVYIQFRKLPGSALKLKYRK